MLHWVSSTTPEKLSMRAIALLALALTSCTWIPQSAVDCQLQLVDDDADGYALSEASGDGCEDVVAVDCDDTNAAINPGAAETWYDGVDADCAVDDDYDQDGDGSVSDDHVGETTENVAGSGELPGGDCDDNSASISSALDEDWYNGIDNDCAGDDDYDQDGDGSVPDEMQGLATEGIDGDGEAYTFGGDLPGGDCDDEDNAVYVGAPDDWYDGLDSDCGGEDDYDADQDTYVSDENAGETTSNVEGSGALDAGDCDDEDEHVNPYAIDEWYDGVDTDCDGSDDYDQDRDNYVPDIYAGLETLYVDGSGTASVGDCDDEDDTVHPEVTELIGDDIDQDCDGDIDSFDLQIFDGEGLGWFGPTDPQLHDVDGVVQLSLLNSVAEVDKKTKAFLYYDMPLLFSLSLTGVSDIAGTADVFFNNTADDRVQTGGMDSLVYDGGVYASVGMFQSSRTMFVAYDVAGVTDYEYNTQGTTDPYQDVTVAVDTNGNLQFFGCDSSGGQLDFIWATADNFSSMDENDDDLLSATVCEAAVLNGQGYLWSDDGGVFQAHSFDVCSAEDCAPNLASMCVVSDTPIDIDIPISETSAALLAADAGSGTAKLYDAECTSSSSIDQFALEGGAPDVTKVAGTYDPLTDELYIAFVDNSTLGLAVPDDAGGWDVSTFGNLNGTAQDVSIVITDAGKIWLAATGVDATTSSETVWVGVAEVAEESQDDDQKKKKDDGETNEGDTPI